MSNPANRLKIALSEERNQYRPGEEVNGVAGWMLEQEPESVEVRLFWFTRGKGTPDVGVVDKAVFEHPAAEDSRSFHFRLPTTPYSFSGKLISLVWALELVVNASQSERREIIVSPTGSEILLNGSPGPAGAR